MPEKPDIRDEKEKDFERKKQKFFIKLGLRVREALKLHKTPGLLWQRNEKGGREWGNVSEHCLVELARFGIFAEKLGFSGSGRRNGELAAAIHDFNKRNEILAMEADLKQGGTGREVSDASDKEGIDALRKAGFNDEVITIANSVGGKPPTLFAIAEILQKESLLETDTARLTIHYVDGYTRGSEWVEPAITAESGEVTNEVDRRTQKNLENPNYLRQNQDSVAAFADHPLLQGRGPIENEGLVCHMIERRLAEIITQRTGEKIDPLALPEIIDQEIRKKIEEEE